MENQFLVFYHDTQTQKLMQCDVATLIEAYKQGETATAPEGKTVFADDKASSGYHSPIPRASESHVEPTTEIAFDAGAEKDSAQGAEQKWRALAKNESELIPEVDERVKRGTQAYVRPWNLSSRLAAWRTPTEEHVPGGFTMEEWNSMPYDRYDRVRRPTLLHPRPWSLYSSYKPSMTNAADVAQSEASHEAAEDIETEVETAIRKPPFEEAGHNGHEWVADMAAEVPKAADIAKKPVLDVLNAQPEQPAFVGQEGWPNEYEEEGRDESYKPMKAKSAEDAWSASELPASAMDIGTEQKGEGFVVTKTCSTCGNSICLSLNQPCSGEDKETCDTCKESVSTVNKKPLDLPSVEKEKIDQQLETEKRETASTPAASDGDDWGQTKTDSSKVMEYTRRPGLYEGYRKMHQKASTSVVPQRTRLYDGYRDNIEWQQALARAAGAGWESSKAETVVYGTEQPFGKTFAERWRGSFGMAQSGGAFSRIGDHNVAAEGGSKYVSEDNLAVFVAPNSKAQKILQVLNDGTDKIQMFKLVPVNKQSSESGFADDLDW